METTTAPTAPVTKFETETCTRCHGSGHFSRCQQYGTTCFKCRGRGITLSKRGQAAADYLSSLRSKRVADLVVGDEVWSDNPFMGKPGWFAVTHIEPCKETASVTTGNVTTTITDRINVNCAEAGRGMYGASPDTMVRVRVTGALADETLAKALAYQASLTASGTVSKRKK